MLIPFLRKRLNDTSISRKLYFTIGFTALLVIIELCTLWFSITTLSAVRSYVGGEGLWSKAQKDAILNLRGYAYSRNEKDYKAFQDFLKVPYGDKAARVALEKENPDIKMATQGFIQGRNHPDDIDGMIKLILRFHKVYYLDKAFTAWAKAEPSLDKLVLIGKKLHFLVGSGAGPDKIDGLLNEIDIINSELTKLEDDFSFTLGEGARWLEALILKLVLTLSLTIGITSTLIAISINRNLKKGVDAIINGAALIRNGDLTARVKVYSKDEIGILATAFNDMTNTLDQNIKELKQTEKNMIREKQRAEISEKTKQRFLINMSHEIRTPMNAILGFARHIDESVDDPDQKESLRMIIESADHLLAILNDILDFTNIETGEITFIDLPFNLRDSVRAVVKLAEPNAALKKIQLSYEIDHNIPELVQGDSVRLTKILLSLVSNAFKFTEEGRVSIHVAILKQLDHSIEIEFKVKDTGIGIPAENHKKIFDVFEQGAGNLTRKFGGTGIGLSIVKHLVTLQGGQIYVYSALGAGAEFCFRLPFSTPQNVISKPDYAPHNNQNIKVSNRFQSRIRVLIAEDNAINQMLAIKLLQKKGYETTVAENGRIAIEKHSKDDFDIILMDLQMPEMDGYETTINIRNMKTEKKNIPIIAMTAHTVKGDMEKCMALGMNAYISKPFHADELFEKIKHLIN